MNSIILLQSSSAINPIIMIAAVAVFWYFIIRPQKNRVKEQEKFVETIEKGKEVVTTGGIIGKISNIDGNKITLAVDSKSTIKVLRSSISMEFTDSLTAKTEKK